ncbi:MAG: hypothetical protein KDA52_08075, partial [Planctomycetaceae bacterium]|nr:hypothetical protein [Planctomycetaceae bacterium]
MPVNRIPFSPVWAFMRRWTRSQMRGGSRSFQLAERSRLVRVESLEDRVLLTTYTVDSLDDVFANDGHITLREALQAANTDAAFNEAAAGNGADVIQFESSLFDAGGRTLTLAGFQLEITDDVTITGPGADLLTIDANSLSRVFMIGDGTDTVLNVALSDMAIANGFVDDISNGGGINNDAEALTIDRMTFRDNVTDGAYISNEEFHFGGGGLFTLRGMVTIRDSTFVGNRAVFGKSGGAILSSRADLTIERTLIDNNYTDRDGGGVSTNYGG